MRAMARAARAIAMARSKQLHHGEVFFLGCWLMRPIFVVSQPCFILARKVCTKLLFLHFVPVDGRGLVLFRNFWAEKVNMFLYFYVF
jgi:hypothetical protein